MGIGFASTFLVSTMLHSLVKLAQCEYIYNTRYWTLSQFSVVIFFFRPGHSHLSAVSFPPSKPRRYPSFFMTLKKMDTVLEMEAQVSLAEKLQVYSVSRKLFLVRARALFFQFLPWIQLNLTDFFVPWRWEKNIFSLKKHHIKHNIFSLRTMNNNYLLRAHERSLKVDFWN